MIRLSFPFTEETISALKVGNEVLISGIGLTGRAAFTPLHRPNCEWHRIIPAPKRSHVEAAKMSRA